MNLPELDLDVDAPDAFCVLAAFLILHIGAEMTRAREPSLIWAVASIYVFGAAIALLVLGITTIDVEEYGRPVAVGAFLAVMSGVGVVYLMIFGTPIQTDALSFIQQASHALLSGESPYTETLNTSLHPPTPLVGGGHISTYSYPVGSALFTAPFAALTGHGARLAVLVATVGVGALLFAVTPSKWAPMALSSLTVGSFATWSVSGITDPLWVLPLAGALIAWPWSSVGPDRLGLSAVLYGIAAAMKQQPWFCSVFLFIWVWRARDLRTAITYAATAAATFLLINGWALIVTPVETVKGILVPLLGDGGGSMVHLGVGLSALTMSGGFPLSKSFHAALLVVAAVVAIAAYWRYFETLRWAAWIAWLPFLFLNYRSLMTYMIVSAPIAALIYVSRLEDSEVSAGAA